MRNLSAVIRTGYSTGAEIKTAYEGESDTNAYTDNEKTKVDSSITEVVEDTSPTLGGNLVCGANQLKTSSYIQIADDTVSSTDTTHTFNYANGGMQQLTLVATQADFTIAFSGFVSGAVCTMIIDLVNVGGYTITWPSGVLFDGGEEPEWTTTGTDRALVVKDKDDVYSVCAIGLDIGTI